FLTNQKLTEKTDQNNKCQNKCFDLKVLSIEDKFENGWNIIMNSLFKKVDNIKGLNEFEDYLVCLKDENIKNIPYDLIILDLNLENEKSTDSIKSRSGYKILDMIRGYDIMIPVIVFTGSEKSDNMQELKNLGIEAYISKPSPSMPNDNVEKQVEKLIDTIEIVNRNTSIHNLWNIFQSINENCNNNFPVSILEKLKVIILKFYTVAYTKTKFYKELNNFNINYNEIIIYCHSIMTDIIQLNKSKYEFKFKQKSKKVLKSWDEYVKEDISKRQDWEPVFDDKCLHGDKNFDENELKLLKSLNWDRNHASPIHGKEIYTYGIAMKHLVTVIYEITQIINDKQIYNEIKSKLQSSFESNNLLKSLWEDKN
ncbi:MAG: response regulator, partial [Spirochaetes bacterium]|nr:response regulator [Spirochaetota bacterium]